MLTTYHYINNILAIENPSPNTVEMFEAWNRICQCAACKITHFDNIPMILVCKQHAGVWRLTHNGL